MGFGDASENPEIIEMRSFIFSHKQIESAGHVLGNYVATGFGCCLPGCCLADLSRYLNIVCVRVPRLSSPGDLGGTPPATTSAAVAMAHVSPVSDRPLARLGRLDLYNALLAHACLIAGVLQVRHRWAACWRFAGRLRGCENVVQQLWSATEVAGR